MGAQEAIRTCFRKYVTFSGRAARSEYWWFFLFVVLIGILASLLDWTLFGQVTQPQAAEGAQTAVQGQGPIQAITGLIVFLPHLAVAWRRMHDTGRSGLYALLPMLLCLGALLVLILGLGIADHFAAGGSYDILFTRITLLVLIPTLIILILSPLLVLFWLSRPSQPGTNSYGPNPAEVTP